MLLGLDERITPATEERLIAVYDVLFETGARLRAYDRDILHGPAIAGAARVAKYLLERGANPNGADGDGNTPVILATKYGHPEVVTVLVAAGAKPLDSATEAQIRLIAAAGRGDLLAFRRELTRGADVNRKGPTGETALVEAVRGGVSRGGNLIVVRELLKLGANPNMSGRFIGESSPLHAAVFNNEKNFESDNGPTIVDTLLKAGAHVSSVAFHRKQTPLHVAAGMQNTQAAILLLKAGAKVMPRDEDGKGPAPQGDGEPHAHQEVEQPEAARQWHGGGRPRGEGHPPAPRPVGERGFRHASSEAERPRAEEAPGNPGTG